MRVVHLAHNHPQLHPGGGEIFAHDLFEAMNARGDVQAFFVGGTDRVHRSPKPGTSLQVIGERSNEMLLWTDRFDEFNLSQPAFDGALDDLRALLLRLRPDVVHFHHSMLLGVEAVQVARRALPCARIVYTLHDYYPICHRGGEMIKAGSDALCFEASPQGCHRCFPAHSPERFLARERHIKSFFRLVDAFVSPSHFLRDRFIAWGLPAGNVSVIPNARPGAPAGGGVAPPADQTVFGCFGNLSRSKGTFLALEATRILRSRRRDDFSLVIHGDGVFPDEDFRATFRRGLEEASPNARHLGAYTQAEMPALLDAVHWVVAPSLWWENAPLVVQEAFRARRPVICSDVGGLAEAVRDGVDGLHFEVGSASSLADTMERAIEDESLWSRCRAGIVAPPDIDEIADRYLAVYCSRDVVGADIRRSGERR